MTLSADTRRALAPHVGLHLADANIALGDLLTVARTEAAAYAEPVSTPLVPNRRPK